MIYDVVIVGAGPSGLFTACHLDKGLNTIIIEKKATAGKKLLMSGSGQCNITNAEDIKAYVNKYGDNGKRIRQLLYKYSNKKLMEFFEERGVPLVTREDGKVFPESKVAEDILQVLLKECREKKIEIHYNEEAIDVEYIEDIKAFSITTQKQKYVSKNIVIGTGGCSYPTTGSDGKMFKLLKNMGIKVSKLKPSLVPIYVNDYPYKELSGISFNDVKIIVFRNHKRSGTGFGDILLTHECFSGPGMINLSRRVNVGDILKINYLGEGTFDATRDDLKDEIRNSASQLNTFIKDKYNLPKRFVTKMLETLEIDGDKKARQISGREMNKIVNKLIDDEYTVSRLGGYNIAMATSGGVELSEIHVNTVESLKYHNLHFVGEVLDVDGDTGGYNLQFAFSSAKTCADRINEKLYRCFKNQLIK